MAISRPYNVNFSPIPLLVKLTGSFKIGASGAVTSGSIVGRNIKAVTKLATGIYRIELTGGVNKLINCNFTLIAGTTGSAVTDGSFVTNTLYQITSLGTTAWTSIGLPSYLTPAVGQAFVATGAGGSGGGTATAIGTTGIDHIELAADPQTSLGPIANTTDGATFVIQCLDAGSATNPTSGTVIRLDMAVRMSSNNEE